MQPLSFNPAMLAAVQAGHKTVTRRRLSVLLPMQQEPGRYRYRGLTAAGAVFEERAGAGVVLPPVPCPYGPVGEVLRVPEDPAIILRVVAIRAEQVRTLTEADARAEGIRIRQQQGHAQWGGVEPDPSQPGCFCWYGSATEAFAGLFNSIYPGAWARNEWVWVVEFAPMPV